MSHAALDRSVRPEDKEKFNISSELEPERIEFYNYRLNEHGRKIVLRMNHDNIHTLLTAPGFNIFRKMNLVKVIKVEVMDKKTNKIKEKKKTIIQEFECVKLAQEVFYKLVDLRLYPPEVARMYSTVKKISFRSIFKSKSYFKVLNSYGHNRKHKLDPVTSRKIVSILDNVFKPWITNPLFEFDLKEELKTGRFLTHIKTNSNSGYPSNIKQTKELMVPVASVSLKIFNEWLINPDKIDWHKFSFEMGYRTERDSKHRVICMAAEYEKPLSAVISVFLDLTSQLLPFNLPRKFGHFKNVAAQIFSVKGGRMFSKDFEAFDTSIPLSLFILLRNWFKQINNTFANLITFELDIIIHSYMIISPNKSFWIASLPSGIGVTQFIGSLIHWLIDLVSGITSIFAIYQADDSLCITLMTDAELQEKINIIKDKFGMDVAPIGEKSFISENYNKFLQKIIDRKRQIYYNHEQRGYTNALFREREISDDTLFSLVFMLDPDAEENKSKKSVLAYLGNLVSFGQFAPSLANIIAFLYGRNKTGFTVTQIDWGLKNIEKYLKEYLEVEQHRPLEDSGWCYGLITALINDYGWVDITAEQVRTTAAKISLLLYV